MKRYKVILFQSYIRKFVSNFQFYLKEFEFCNVAGKPRPRTSYSTLTSYDTEMARRKLNGKTRLRRILGIPNIRIRFDRQGDLFFTYGALILTPKPYCTYIETGLTLYNYDLGIAKNPIARWLVMFFATRKNCKQLIFLSEAARKSFFATVHYPKRIEATLQKKSSVIYPIPINGQSDSPKKWQGELKLLFAGLFYMKGGLELVHAFAAARNNYPNISLTLITSLHVMKAEDIAYVQSVPGIKLLDAKLSEEEMIEAYRSHDVFVLPTYREGFGLVLIEALAYGMPLIITDQFATAEMARPGKNGFVFPTHPLKDYDPKTYRLFGQYYEPRDFYAKLHQLQQEGKMAPVEEFLTQSFEAFLTHPGRLEQFSRQSLKLYQENFNATKLGAKLEAVFLNALGKGKVKPNPGK